MLLNQAVQHEQKLILSKVRESDEIGNRRYWAKWEGVVTEKQ